MSTGLLPPGPILELGAALDAAHDATKVSSTSPLGVAGLPESRRLSDQLGHMARVAGLETIVGRRLLQLRDDLDSHVLAASMLEESGGANAVRILRRGVEAVAADLRRVGTRGFASSIACRPVPSEALTS